MFVENMSFRADGALFFSEIYRLPPLPPTPPVFDDLMGVLNKQRARQGANGVKGPAVSKACKKRPLARPFVRLFVRGFVFCSFVRPCVRSFVRSLVRSLRTALRFKIQ